MQFEKDMSRLFTSRLETIPVTCVEVASQQEQL